MFNGAHSIQNTGAILIPCQNCVGCKLEYSRQWMLRLTHEALYWPQSCFITLTYNQQNLPQSNSLDPDHLQNFYKRLRDRLDYQPLKHFSCGEYGDRNFRPHYHAIIFGWAPTDQSFWKLNRQGDRLYISKMLEDTWGHGFCSVAPATAKSMAYVARYVVKKIKGKDDFQAAHYYRCSPVDGKMHSVQPEFGRMSQGLGKRFAADYKSDFVTTGSLHLDGKRQAIPRYYMQQLSEEEQHSIKLLRLRQKQPRSERTMERKVAREGVRNARITQLKREL